MVLTYIMLGVYILALIFIGLKDHKSEDKDGFIIADRKVGIIGTLSSISASFRDGGGLILWVGMGFALGYGLYGVFLGFILALIALSFLAPRARRLAKQKNYITMPQMVRDEVGAKTEKASGFVVLAFAILCVSIQFFVLGNIASMLLGINPFNSILFTAVIVAFYVSLGGYKSIVKTDIMQFFIMLSLWVFVFMVPLQKEVVLDFATIYTSHSPKEFIFIIIYGFVLLFSMSDFWQRMFSAKNDKAAVYGTRLTGLSMLLMTLPLTFIGMSARGLIPAGTVNNDVVMSILTSPQYPSFMISFFTLVGISITMSTLDTYTYIFSSTLLENFLKVNISLHKKKYIYMSKIIMIAMLAVSAVLALSITDVVEYMLNSLSIFMVLSPLFLVVGAGWLKHRSKKLDTYFMWSLIAAFVIGCYLFVQGYLVDFAWMMIPPALATIFMAISYIVAKLQHKA